MNSTVHSARFVEKTDTTHADTFKGRQMGCLGYMQDGRPRLYQQPLRKHTWSSDLAAPKELPAVAIVYAYVGLTADDVRRLAQGKAGLVITGLGHGKMPETVWQALQPLMEQGLVVVRAARALGGMVTAGYTVPAEGAAPALGWSGLSADGEGGVQADADGSTYLVVDVDTTAKTVTFVL